MKIGEYVAQYRVKNGLSQRAFAQQAGLSTGVIAFLEKGEYSNGVPYVPRMETVRKVANAMGMSEEQLENEAR